jgi:hypothetical protein
MTDRRRLVTIALAAGAVLVATVLWIRPARGSEKPACGHVFTHTLKVRVWEPGGVAPSVSVNVPVVLVSTVLKVASIGGFLDRALEKASRDGGDPAPVRLKSAQIEALWSQISHAGPVQLVAVDDGAGSRVEVRID